MVKLDELPNELLLHIASFFHYKRPSKLRIYEDVDTLPICKNLRNERLHLISLSLTCRLIYNILAKELQELHRFIAIGHKNSTRKLFSLLFLLQESPHIGEQVTELYIHLQPVFVGRTAITQSRLNRLVDWGRSKGLDVDPSGLRSDDDEEMNDWETVTEDDEDTSGVENDSLNTGDLSDPDSAEPTVFATDTPPHYRMDGIYEHAHILEGIDDEEDSDFDEMQFQQFQDEDSDFDEMEFQDEEYLAFMAVLLLGALPRLEEITISTSSSLLAHFQDQLSLQTEASGDIETGGSPRDTLQRQHNGRPLSSLKSVTMRYYYPPMGWHKNAAQSDEVATFAELGLNVTELCVQKFSIQYRETTPPTHMANLTSLILKNVYFHDGTFQDFLQMVPHLTKFMYFDPYEYEGFDEFIALDAKLILDTLKRSPAAKHLLTLCLSSDPARGYPGFGLTTCSPETSYDTLEDFVSLQNLWLDTWGFCHAPVSNPDETTAKNSVIRTLPSSLRRVHFSGSTIELQSSLSWLSKTCKPNMLPHLEEIAFEYDEKALQSIYDTFQAVGVRASRDVETAPVVW